MSEGWPRENDLMYKMIKIETSSDDIIQTDTIHNSMPNAY